MGALSYTLAGTDALRLIAELTPAETGNDEMLLQRLAPFLLAGLQSPLPDLADAAARARRRPAAAALTRSPADRLDPHVVLKESSMLTLLWLVAVLVGALALAYVNASGLAFTAAIAVALGVAWVAHTIPGWLALALTLVFVAARDSAATCRRCGASSSATRVLAAFRKVMPPMSQTERDAIEAGTVWWDGELFSGRPDWRRLLDTPLRRRSPPKSSAFSTTTSRSSARW